ncbi:DUF3775 domain-containing protein [Legionella maioricensis]|uniref:DUF3775 domain-containing protein n=1 Tax=Legionella maioricensis TaxID=2896528 RepID=A0A9X2IBZ7_9GAMM|nr:DUF3775 domain-containing protein [Legionella maioricensis]MCL9683887.1 DUF3775 domain-containing protein [Legionella maioricensis]MCL9686734.1 DUF3775 domain-containing protein [Legionella maioricensis]
MLNTDILNINPQTVCFIIAKAKEFQAKEGVTFDEETPNAEYEYDTEQVLADHPDDLSYLEVSQIIESLDPDQKVDLLCLMYLGRGDFGENDWSNAHKEARNNLAPNLTGYLFSKPTIAYYLEKGLECLGYSCNE